MKRRLLFLLALILVTAWLSPGREPSARDNLAAGVLMPDPEAWLSEPPLPERQLPTLSVGAWPMQHQMTSRRPHLDASMAGSITGRVYAADGTTPLKNILVAVDEAPGGTCTNAAGVYWLTDVPLNTPVYVLAASTAHCGGPPAQYYGLERWQEAVVRSDATQIVLTPSNPQRTNIDFTLEIGGVFSGRIYEADGSTPIGYEAWLEVLDIDPTATVGPGDVEPDGRYVTWGLPPGTYISYAGAHYHGQVFYEHTPFAPAATPIEISAGSRVEGIDFALGPGGTITGRVVADDGVTPLDRICVGLWDDDIFRHSWLGNCTDETGVYTILWVPVDTPFTIYAGGSGNWCIGGPSVYEMEWWREARQWSEASPISISEAQPHLTGISFTLGKVGDISGTVYEADGMTPVSSGPWVSILDPVSAVRVATGHVQSGGGYEVRDLPVGTYLVAAAIGGRALEFYQEAGPYLDAATPVQVSAGTTAAQARAVIGASEIDFTLEPGGAIRGTVFAEDGHTPLQNVAVGATGTWLRDCTDASGAYEIYHVPFDEPFTLFAGTPGWCPGSAGYYREWWQEVDTLESATAITVTTGQPDVNGIDFTLGRLPPAAYLPIISRH